ncbi:peptide-methionine (S)-S-oxide reductase MsrA [Corynebacterium sphenisci]|uniref:peptide-methionine (S)-S-oxide reductase MsrA n=1 Tax=Corynebacterium sphenisci TaxID=191493 RepID=UPI0026DFE65A|nr:peptide-methionine (S)-S-oxide reductase MsrA [Corynebacterium sphenisci]MDO5732098.1 peptide-methionine (S)-S-oxide reductase MsrA [Corynebacterium sphenisci]
MVSFPRPRPRMVDPARALRGGEHPVLPDPPPHRVLGTPLTGPWRAGQAEIILGMGCFWGAEKLFWNLAGVESTAVGYAGGYTANPTYREVCTGRTGHAEVVRVVYDPDRLPLRRVLAVMLENHDPTQGHRQGADVGTQYRSAIYPHAEEDLALARAMVGDYGARLRERGFGAPTTELRLLGDTPAGRFFLAEEAHQQYLAANPGGYCPVHATGVACGD